MAEIWFDVDTAITECPVNVMPLIDDTDFKSREVAIAYNAAGMDLVWNFVTSAGAFTQTAVTPTTAGDYDWTHQGDGMYTIEIPASGGVSINNDTEGHGWFTGLVTGVLPWRGPVIGFRASGLNDLLIDSAYSATRGLSGTALPAAAADAAGGLPISDAGALDLDAKIGALTFTVANQVDANAIAISGDTVAADNLELQYDTTGLTGDSFPATQAQLENVANVGAAVNVAAESYTLTTGVQSSGTYASTAALDGTNHEHTDTTGVMELYYQFDVTDDGTPTSVTMTGYLTGGNDSLGVYAYNWAGTSWDQIGTLQGGAASNSVHNYTLYVSHVGTAANAGKVRIRFYAASGLTTATLAVDQIYTSYAYVPLSMQTAGSISDLTPSTTSFDTDLTQADSIWDDALLIMTSGTYADVARPISAYLNASGNITLDEALPGAPANGDTFVIVHTHIHPVTQIADQVWDEATSGHATAGTTGKALTDILADSNELQADWANGGRLDVIIDAILAMLDDPRAEPGQGAPAVNADAMTKIDYIYKFLRNRVTSTATTISVYDDAGTTVDHKATHSDDATTYDRGEFVSGP